MLGHYGVTGLDRSPELEAAVFRIFLAQQRLAADAAVVAELLRPVAGERAAGRAAARAGRARARAPHRGDPAALPAVADLARGVVFRWFAQPLLRRNRARVYAAVRDDLRYLDRTRTRRTAPSGSRRWWPRAEPLVRLLGQRHRARPRPPTTRRCLRC